MKVGGEWYFEQGVLFKGGLEGLGLFGWLVSWLISCWVSWFVGWGAASDMLSVLHCCYGVAHACHETCLQIARGVHTHNSLTTLHNTATATAIAIL